MEESIAKIGEENRQMVEVPITVEIEYLNGIEDNNPKHIIDGDIKQEPKISAELQLIKRGLPTNTHTDIKQEPMDIDQTDPDDVTTQSIPEGSEQHEMEDIKYVNTQDYLDIGETVISEQDRAMSEQDRAKPGTSSNEYESEPEGKKNKCGEKPHRCEICDSRFTSTKYLKKHMTRTHTGEMPFKCKACDRQFKWISILKEHLRTHTGEKPFKCEDCGYRCAKQSSLKSHMKTHTGEKPYKCDNCDYRFTFKSDLNRHTRTHTGEKPFKCEACDYRCTVGSSLKIHMKIHTGEKPYKCNTCGYQCAAGSNLKKHIRTHTGGKP